LQIVNLYVNFELVKEVRKLEFYRSLFAKFYGELPAKVQYKYDYVLVIVRQAERIPIKFFKKLKDTNGIFEIRVEYASNTYRKFCCYDGNNVIVLFNSIHKKSAKTPPKEIKKAEKLKKAYFNEKENRSK